jgi:hypothetical protein
LGDIIEPSLLFTADASCRRGRRLLRLRRFAPDEYAERVKRSHTENAAKYD